MAHQLRSAGNYEGLGLLPQNTISGAKAERPGLGLALEYLRDGDVLVVWRLDRLGRSLPHLIEVIGALEARGVGFRSLTESIDTTTSGGRLIFHVFGALGQFERDLIRDRTKKAGLAAAARGRKGGRKPVVSNEKLQRAKEHLANGLNVREAAARLKVGKTALYAALQVTDAKSSAGDWHSVRTPSESELLQVSRRAHRKRASSKK